MTQEQHKAERRAHYVWQEALCAAASINPMLRVAGLRLSMYRNKDTGRCFVDYPKFAEAIGVGLRQAIRYVAELERLGWITVTRGGGKGKANEYHFELPPQTVTTESHCLETSNSDIQRRPEPANSDIRPPQTVTHRESLQQYNRGPSRGRANRAAPARGEEDVLAHVTDPRGAGGALEKGAPRLEEISEPQESIEPGPNKTAMASEPELFEPEPQQHRDRAVTVIAPGDAAFATLSALWKRSPWVDDPAVERRAYAKACKLAAPEVILAAAKRVVRITTPRKRQSLAKWLDRRGWLNAPPADAPPQEARRTVSTGRVMMEIAR